MGQGRPYAQFVCRKLDATTCPRAIALKLS
jgi:hypothetical protein